MCEVVWRGGSREWLPQHDLAWVGLTIHTHDGRAGRVIGLGRQRIEVRLGNGTRCWMKPDELAPRESQPDISVEFSEEGTP
jgi:hypothetical protein